MRKIDEGIGILDVGIIRGKNRRFLAAITFHFRFVVGCGNPTKYWLACERFKLTGLLYTRAVKTNRAGNANFLYWRDISINPHLKYS